jgi:hypothetical protein
MGAIPNLPSIVRYTHSRYEENIGFYIRLGYSIDSQDQIADGFRVNMSKRIGLADG